MGRGSVGEGTRGGGSSPEKEIVGRQVRDSAGSRSADAARTRSTAATGGGGHPSAGRTDCVFRSIWPKANILLTRDNGRANRVLRYNIDIRL